MKTIIIILCLVFLFTGCIGYVHYYGFDFNSTSNARCAVECEEMMRNFSCLEGGPSYQESYTNGEKTYGNDYQFLHNLLIIIED
jgi:hypothetical protein